MEFTSFFARMAAPPAAPYSWQRDLAADDQCRSRLIRIPTGFGKTFGVAAAWAFHRLERKSPGWPRRLVWCLPMRVLVEQTEEVLRQALGQVAPVWDGKGQREGKVGIHVLMGGSDALEWALYPEESAVLIGTQDMLLSRALNRGYGSHRPRWPMEFGLLSQDSLWVMDEVQLMDVGLATGAQLQSFRDRDSAKGLAPTHTWWMSATLQRPWLESVDTRTMVAALPATAIAAPLRNGHLWDDVSKPHEIRPIHDPKDAKALAEVVKAEFLVHGRGRLTLVVMNTVDRAQKLHAALQRALNGELEDGALHLVHSRFRPRERGRWSRTFLRRDAAIPPQGRIVVATQVVEAGVDLDAALLCTELAPWPSLVQRFGRAARGGGVARIVVLDFGFEGDKAAPYEADALDSAREALRRLPDVSPLGLETFEESLSSDEIATLYPYRPKHLLLRQEWDELFDTTPDLTGADVDISRFIRSGDERDIQVFWADVPAKGDPPRHVQPGRLDLCGVPFLAARAWLCGDKGEKLSPGRRAWVWDWIDGSWRRCRRSDVTPGRTVLVDAATGGYDPETGWSPRSTEPVPVESAAESKEVAADAAEDGEDLSASAWKTIATHGGEVEALARQIAQALALPQELAEILALAGRWHDLGKAHGAFQGSIRGVERPGRQDLAKAPDQAWGREHRYRTTQGGHRPGFRHELASALALFAVLVRHQPDHPALLGPHLETLRAVGVEPDFQRLSTSATPDEAAVLALTAQSFDLLAYLVACHHGKVRCSLHSSPKDQDFRDTDGRGLPIRGVRTGDILPPTAVSPAGPLPALDLSLEPATLGLSPVTGSSWSERVMGLQDRFGPGALGLLEACLRSADVRASRLTTVDPLLAQEDGR